MQPTVNTVKNGGRIQPGRPVTAAATGTVEFARPKVRKPIIDDKYVEPNTPSPPPRPVPFAVCINTDAPQFDDKNMASNVGLYSDSFAGFRGIDIVFSGFTLASLFSPNTYSKQRAVLILSEKDVEALLGIHQQVVAQTAEHWHDYEVALRAPVGDDKRFELGFPTRRGDSEHRVSKPISITYESGAAPNEYADIKRVNELLRTMHAKSITGELNLWALQDRNDATKLKAGFYCMIKNIVF